MNLLTSATIDLGNKCTDPTNDGCKRTGSENNILNPVKTASIKTSESFSFKYGELEIRAKMPSGDWLRPSIWLLSKDDVSNAAITFLESRGNQQLIDVATGKNIGNRLIKSTLSPTVSFEQVSPYGFDDGLHTYKLTWTSTSIEFRVDGILYGTYPPPAAPNQNPPPPPATHTFNNERFIMINLGVGGNNFVPSGYTYNMPWSDLATDTTPATKFWSKKTDWLPTWRFDDFNRRSSMIVDYVKVTAV